MLAVSTEAFALVVRADEIREGAGDIRFKGWIKAVFARVKCAVQMNDAAQIAGQEFMPQSDGIVHGSCSWRLCVFVGPGLLALAAEQTAKDQTHADDERQKGAGTQAIDSAAAERRAALLDDQTRVEIRAGITLLE